MKPKSVTIMTVVLPMVLAVFAMCGGCGGGGENTFWDDIGSTPGTPVCGNALLEAGEVCDDGNVTDNDGCSSDCRLGLYKTYESDRHVNVVLLDQDSDGKFVVAGNIQEQADDRAVYDLFVYRIEPDGADVSKYEYGRDDCSEMPYTATGRRNGGWLIGGHRYQCNTGDSDGWILDMGPRGAVEWEWFKETSGNDYVVLYGINETDDGGVIAGGSQRLDSQLQDMYIVKLNESGTKEWEKVLGGDDADIAMDVLQASSGDYVVLGRTSSYGSGLKDIWLVGIDSTGSTAWESIIGSEQSDYASAFSETKDGGFIIGGSSSHFDGGASFDLYVVKTDSRGNQSWYFSWGDSGEEKTSHIIQVSDEGYVVVGGTTSYGSGSSDIFIVKLDSAGNMEWSKVYGSSQYDIAKYVKEIDGGYLVAGETCEYMDVYCDVVLIEVDENGECNGCP